MNPEDTPERAVQLLTDSSRDVGNFYASCDETTDLEYIREYPKTRGGGRTYPAGCDDMLMTYTWEDDEDAVRGLPTGERPHEAYLTVARNAAAVQHDAIFKLMAQMRNLGDPVFPEIMFGGDHTPDREPDSELSYSLVNVNTQNSVEQDNEEVVTSQLEFFETVDKLNEQCGQPVPRAED